MGEGAKRSVRRAHREAEHAVRRIRALVEQEAPCRALMLHARAAHAHLRAGEDALLRGHLAVHARTQLCGEHALKAVREITATYQFAKKK